MPKYKAIVQSLDARQAHLVLEDGTMIAFPASKLPDGVIEGTFLTISISVDRIAALLRKASSQMLPREAKS